MFIGIACLFMGILDVMHVLTYEGTSVFAGMSGDESFQLETAGCWIAGLSILVAPLFFRWKLKPTAILLVYSGVLLLVCGLVLLDALPRFALPEEGLPCSSILAAA